MFEERRMLNFIIINICKIILCNAKIQKMRTYIKLCFDFNVFFNLHIIKFTYLNYYLANKLYLIWIIFFSYQLDLNKEC